MKRLTILICALITFLACGAPDTIPLEFGPEPEELAEVEQAQVAELNGGGYRVDGEEVQNMCTGGASAAQKCMLPTDKSIRVKLSTSGMDPTDAAEATAALSTIISSLNTQFLGTGWSWSNQTIQPDINIVEGVVSNFAAATDLRFYERIACNTQGAAMTEPVAAPGTYHRCTTATATVDYDKIFGSFGQGNKKNVIFHAIGAAAIAPAGLGLNSSHTGKISSRVTSGSTKSSTLQDREKCRVNAQNLSNTSTISFTNDCNL